MSVTTGENSRKVQGKFKENSRKARGKLEGFPSASQASSRERELGAISCAGLSYRGQHHAQNTTQEDHQGRPKQSWVDGAIQSYQIRQNDDRVGATFYFCSLARGCLSPRNVTPGGGQAKKRCLAFAA